MKFKSLAKKVLKMILIFVLTIISLIVVLLIVILIQSTGKPDPFLDKSGKLLKNSLSEKIFVEIGGIQQGMFIMSKNIENPVLLYIHGGPAFPNYFLIDKYEPGLEDYFTVCYWEQRGGGLSFTPEVSLESMNFEQLTSDAIEVTNYLRKRFNKDKIYIMAHSGGTPIALKAVYKSPELYVAYMAMAQITNQKESEKIAYKYMIDEFSRKGNKKDESDLKKFDVLKSDSNIMPFYKSVIRDKTMHELGIGTMHNMNSIFWDIFIPVWTCKAYTLTEKINIWKSKFSFLPKTNLIKELLSIDFTQEIEKIEIPVYFFSGKYDLTVNVDLSRAYYKKLKAPKKGFYTFSKSAHSPLFEEPDRFKEILENDILKGLTNFCDKE
ncbi:MAG: alpha/beta hydrolase [Bacteroidales bacterium]|nr:alpha/beta hydrolase [Bacteroidales bacterium]